MPINDPQVSVTSLKLCYVDPRSSFAWFTSIDLKDQWGDDWDDAPYEHNAGEPYDHTWKNRESISHHLVKVAWDGPWNTPAELAGSNSYWSVKGINAGCVAWLIPNDWNNKGERKPVPAGVSLQEFASIIVEGGGNVYVPLWLANQIQ